MMMVMTSDAFNQSIQTIHTLSIYFITGIYIFPIHHCAVMKAHVYWVKIPLFEKGAFHLPYNMTFLRKESFWEAFVL